jgi:hypothetical protein
LILPRVQQPEKCLSPHFNGRENEMSLKKHSPLYQWEREMIDAFEDDKRSRPVDRWHLVLDLLHEEFQRWKAGEIFHDGIDKAIHTTHRVCQLSIWGLLPRV